MNECRPPQVARTGYRGRPLFPPPETDSTPMRRALLFGLPAAATWLALTGASSVTPTEGATHPANETRELYLAQCATCHGETGDGKGVTQLDRPARSFLAGGFSYGNTPDALYRTITSGIPGTPMPGFEQALTEEQRRALADFVISLGPPLPEVDTSRAVLQVSERPQVVRGLLPPIAPDTPQSTRGLLVGMPSGVTFQWRTDDVRLLGLRMGDFVERSDWTGRGGAPLKPLGRVVHLLGGGKPDAPWMLESRRERQQDGSTVIDAESLQARFSGSWVRGADAGLSYTLRRADGTNVARIEDDMHVLGTSVGAGYRRRLRIAGATEGKILAVLANGGGQPVASFTTDSDSGSIRWEVRKLDQGMFECAGVHSGGAGGGPAASSSGPVARIELTRDTRTELLASVVLTAAWNEEVQQALQQEVRP